MREIKFRAWFPKEHYSKPHMAYSPTDRTDEFGGRSSTWALIGLYEAASDTESPIYMQYTGLKDKNDVEIYEGDVVRYKTDPPKYVEYKDGQFQLSTEATYRKSSLGMFASGLEILGNIYENPELLK